MISGRTTRCTSEMTISEMKLMRLSMLGMRSVVLKCSSTSALVIAMSIPLRYRRSFTLSVAPCVMTGSTRISAGSLRLRASSAAKRMKVPVGRPPASPTVQLLIWRTLDTSPVSAAVGARTVLRCCAQAASIDAAHASTPANDTNASACPNLKRIVASPRCSGASESLSMPPAGGRQPSESGRIRGNVSISPARMVVPSRRPFWGRNWVFFGQIRLSDPIPAGTAPTPARCLAPTGQETPRNRRVKASYHKNFPTQLQNWCGAI